MKPRIETADRITQHRAELARASDVSLSVADTVRLLGNHFLCRNARRLPALAMQALLECTMDLCKVQVTLTPNAADEQTGATGDVEITLENDDRVCTVYEMKQKVVTLDDLDWAVQKVAGRSHRIDNYVVITTDRIDPAVSEYAATLYESTGGTEYVVLDCLGFVRHYLHLFHRRRAAFLDAYQSLVLDQPDSAVGLPLKEAFLALRRAAIESDE